MKGKLDDGTPVDIEKPLPIEQDGKWWEAIRPGNVKKGENYFSSNSTAIIISSSCDHSPQDLHWIASEIPRATPDQLRAIGMKEREWRPVICKARTEDRMWDGKYQVFNLSENHELVGKYRFVLVPVEKKKVHTSCEGCENEKVFVHSRCFYCGFERKNYTPTQPPQPEEPRFSVGEIDSFLDDFCKSTTTNNWYNCVKRIQARLIRTDDGIATFTERRRNEGKV